MASLDGSSIGAAPFSKIVQRLVDERIEASGFNVSHELTIPVRRVKLGKPGAKHGSVFVGESTDGFFELLHRAHITSFAGELQVVNDITLVIVPKEHRLSEVTLRKTSACSTKRHRMS